jgi:Barstar (barnase inhibitor)
VAAFRRNELAYTDKAGEQQSRIDWGLMNFGPIALFQKAEVLADTTAWLAQQGYTVAHAKCETCESEGDVLWTIGQILGFPHWPTPNLDGLNDDCFHLEVPEKGGLAVVLQRFDLVHGMSPDFARKILDIFAWTVWNNLLYGRRLLCLVQSDDPRIQFGRIGGREPWWNNREWFASQRGL